jgi:hypothetical protein
LRGVTAGHPSRPFTQIAVAETVPVASGDFQTEKTKKPRHL